MARGEGGLKRTGPREGRPHNEQTDHLFLHCPGIQPLLHYAHDHLWFFPIPATLPEFILVTKPLTPLEALTNILVLHCLWAVISQSHLFPPAHIASNLFSLFRFTLRACRARFPQLFRTTPTATPIRTTTFQKTKKKKKTREGRPISPPASSSSLGVLSMRRHNLANLGERGRSENMECCVIGLGTMGASLARNAARRGARVVIYNRSPERGEEFVRKYRHEGNFLPVHQLEDLKTSMATPRLIIVMVTAGDAIDAINDSLLPILDPGDIVVDGGNSNYRDTERRIAKMSQRGIHFVGMGVSGGEEGALLGPSMMPGGDPATWARCSALLTSMAADDGVGGKCACYCGPGGAGHFVKVTHNGIEYAIMQSLAEGYDILRKVGGLTPSQLHEVFTQWNAEGSILRSFLVEITAAIFSVRDTETPNMLVDMIRPHAEQKGTGYWTVEASLHYGAPAPTIAAALFARFLSGAKELRAHNNLAVPHPTDHIEWGTPAMSVFLRQVRSTVELSTIMSYIQGFEILKAASNAEHWNIPLAEIARIWRGGCIIRSALLPIFQKAFVTTEGRDWMSDDLKHLFTDELLDGARRTLSLATLNGIPVAALSASLSYYDSICEPNLPQNLVQAQRDCFGAHTYGRIDKPETEKFHTQWIPSQL
ncbi:putative 6-phosphogluconate dehydrogenase; decarboxylating [Paratrimastix pyriformis]|uniref:6-phosphogluconate dehydrogenase, decarboxylating n=1 Tax=Paratrimastix pyriformis TaxID=342808 RepID=A0ABQ8UR16_9EUKA|nr:putative 6-phosphogluconate dehydrogenase; decarboxylating [Paratrimastix pyriformis]